MSNSKNSFKACLDAIKVVITSLKSVKKMNETIDNQIKKAATLCINHGREHHDDTPMMRLINEVAIYDTVRAGNLKKFFENNAPVKFELGEDKKSIENVKEVKDKDGNLKKAYMAEDVLEKLPIAPQPKVTTGSTAKTNTPTPISYKFFQERIESLEQQLTKAIEPGGRGILGTRNGKQVTMHNTDKEYRQFYEPLSKYIRNIIQVAKTVVPLYSGDAMVEKTEGQQVNTEAANDRPAPKGQKVRKAVNGHASTIPAKAEGRTRKASTSKSKAA